MSKRLLVIAYAFPPVGGSGVQRVTKFVKYLPAFGWESSVLTVANPSVPLYDESLLTEIPAGTIIKRTRTWEPGYAFKAAVSAGTQGPGRQGVGRGLVKGLLRRLSTLVLQPDPQILSLPGRYGAGLRLLRTAPHHAILATGPPFSEFLLGSLLNRRTGLPLVLDYRDEWDISNAYWENKRLDPLSRSVQTRMQRGVVRRAGALVATTRSSAHALEQIRRRAGGRAQVSWIYNGYDAEDFPASEAAPPARGEPYRLAYVGTLWNLTSVEPLVQAVAELGRRRPDLAGNLELVFAGRRTAAQQQILDHLKGLPSRLVEHGYLDHQAAVEVTRSSHGLLVLLSELPHLERVVPAKVFETMATRKPVLTIAPRGELWELLADYPAGRVFEPRDVQGIATFLAQEVQRHKEGRPLPCLDGWNGTRYERRCQTGQLVDILDALAGRRATNGATRGRSIP
jgi:glycosyltransferase involved in cell wall biosynthesis